MRMRPNLRQEVASYKDSTYAHDSGPLVYLLMGNVES